MKKIDVFLLSLLLLIGLTLRLYHITSPLADWHSWRQADTAAVARNFVEHDFNILLPRFDDLSNVQSNLYNPDGYRMVEFPLYNGATALLHMAVPLVPVEVAGRIISIIFSLIILSIIYYLLLKEHSRIAATIGALVFSIFPFFVYYSRVVLPDMSALGCIMISIFCLYKWEHTKKGIASWILISLSLVGLASALLIKPTTIFYTPVLVYLFFRSFAVHTFRNPVPFVYFVVSVIPLALWRLWIEKYPAGIPLSQWLFTSVNTSLGLQQILLRPSFFRWVFFERIAMLILGGYLLVLFVMGLIKRPKEGYFLLTFPFCAIWYLLIFEGGNVQHDYYQIMILPALAICIGLGASYLLSSTKAIPHRIFNMLLVIALIVSSWYFSYFKVRDYYAVSDQILKTAHIISTLTEPDSYIATDTTGDTTLLYLAHRKGFPSLTDDPDKLAERGIKYLLTYNIDYGKQLEKQYHPIFVNDNLYLFTLQK